ncbi:MAG: alpha/beta fold hydrolase [Spirochaetaceae bacterium]|nr:alpha/beta fold hydrolase [Spirochaetaceae bacterium]
MKYKLILKTIIALLILLVFFFAQGAVVVVNHLEGTKSALIRGGIIWLLVISTLLYFTVKYKNISILGFRSPKHGSSRMFLFYIPLLLIAFLHFVAGLDIEAGVDLFVANLFLALSIGMAEEIFFRGIICNIWLEKSPVKAMVISSVLFGVCHLMNIAGGAGIVSTLLQICFAVIYGLVFALIRIRSNSLIPCVLLHTLHDICSFISAECSVTMNVIIGVIQAVILVMYFIYLMKGYIQLKEKRKKKIIMTALCIVGIIVLALAINFIAVRKTALDRFAVYEAKAKTIDTSYGQISYIDEGVGEPFLICHGITGGYDQGFDVLSGRTADYRVIAPSRFGYPGSDMPKAATVDMQAEAFAELLDELGIEKVFITATSAGGTIAQRFALIHPERCKGLILYCSGYPAIEKPEEPASGIAGPPAAFCNDFVMWLISPLFKPIMGMERSVIKQIMPMKERKEGIVFDGDVVNKDHTNHYENYNLRNIKVPVLIIHSEDDKLANPEKAKYWSNEIPGCNSVFFSGGGHLMTGNSEEINHILDEFVEKNK